jgi:hypothetical protein
LIDAVRVESGSDLLEQAEALLETGQPAAATVIAGGALESHVKYICDKHGVSFSGHGSVSAYKHAVAQGRKAGHEICSANDGKFVDVWDGLRKEAAHRPGAFTESNDGLIE